MIVITCDRCQQPVTDPTTVDICRGRRTDEERELIAEVDLCRACEGEILKALGMDPYPWNTPPRHG